LGSGPGLGGFLAAHWAKKVTLSDYQDLVMDLLKLNIRECNPKPESCQMTIAKLDWCVEENLNVDLLDPSGTKMGLLKDCHYDVIIGTDIVYWPTIIVPLVKTLVSLF
jgi:predicted nicotinamide N-methyase